MLKTPEERVRLLKNGVEMKKIEELYIQYNRLKVIQSPILFDFIETTMQSCISPDAPEVELKQKHQVTDGDENSKILLSDLNSIQTLHTEALPQCINPC